MKSIVFTSAFFTLLFSFNGCAQKELDHIAFYNVENLFDTLDTPQKNDEEFLPEGKNHWNTPKYQEKLNHISKVYEELGKPVVMGFCEIENRAVVDDIVNTAGLNGKYAVIHRESLDNRGIDNAMIYDSTRLFLEDSGILRFNMPEGSGPSRDILWAKFNKNGSVFFVMVNHWPSRSGGQVETEPKRLIAAQAAEKFIDSLMGIDKNSKIVFMGDLNDTPENMAPKMISSKLQPMIIKESGEFQGSHNYRGEWDILDHIMVSKGALKGSGVKVKKKSGKIHSPDYLLSEYKGNTVPFRTYGGGKYLGGYSDHLPVSIDVKL